ncbi:MAG: hypothetical protein M0030_12730 [Actinomycetota bacterium]|nr:hypothetical protein [Actinomycetota bacterium]
MYGDGDLPQAAGALDRAERIRSAVESRSRWLIRYQAGFGAGSLVMVAMLAVPWPAGLVASVALWVMVVAALGVYAAVQPVVYRGMVREHLIMLGAWTLLYLVVLIVGVTTFRGDGSWWLAGALVVSLPGFGSAIRTARRTAR